MSNSIIIRSSSSSSNNNNNNSSSSSSNNNNKSTDHYMVWATLQKKNILSVSREKCFTSKNNW